MELFKKASLPSIEDYAKELVVRKNLTGELGRSIRSLQEENLGKTVVADTDECANSLCYVIEAILIHGLKDKLAVKVSSVFGSNSEKMPEPEFWTYVSKYCHKNVLLELKNLNQITNDIGRGRAWLRIALNDGLIISYLGTMLADKPALQKFYCTTAYLRDEEQSDIMKQLLEGTSVFHFELSCNSSILNSWNCLPLTLAHIWIPPATPQPVMPAVDVIDFFTDRKKQTRTKDDSQSVKSRESVAVQSQGDEATESASVECNKPVSETDVVYVEHSKASLVSAENNARKISKEEDKKVNEVCSATNKELESECHDNEDTSSKISSSDSVPDFGNEVTDDSAEMPFGSFGNKLDENSGWSSVFNDEQEQRDNEASQSYDSLLQSYNKNLSKVVIGTPELSDTFSSIMGKAEDEYIVITLFIYFFPL